LRVRRALRRRRHDEKFSTINHAIAQKSSITTHEGEPNSVWGMDALLELIGPQTDFPSTPRALNSLQRQLELQAKFFRSKYGRLIRSLLGEAQSNEELARAFRERWICPRREGVIQILRMAIKEGDLRDDIDLETTTDMLYGPLYYRLLVGTGEIDDAFTDGLFRQLLQGTRGAKSKHARR
jgi:Tetracyclin repressor-like, C-terminal domain